MSSSRSSLQFWAACGAAFAAGCAAGAACMQYYYHSRWSKEGQNEQRPQVPTIDLSQLQGFPVPSAATLSPTASVSSYSLPPTPRLSRSGSNGGNGSRHSGAGDAGLRMVFVVRKDLQWGKQKTAVMTAHAALALFKKLYKSRHPALMQWELAKGPKLVLRADNEQQLLAAMEAARAAGIPHHSIAEAAAASSSGGGTAAAAEAGSSSSGGGGEVVQGVPRKSRTILALGPLPAEELPKIAAGLVLL